jgi:hypothetical protein
MSRNLFWLSDEQWARIEPDLPTDVRGVAIVAARLSVSSRTNSNIGALAK